MDNERYLAHFGILGQRWGVRRFQNADGSLNVAGRKNQSKMDAKQTSKNQAKELHKMNKSGRKAILGPTGDASTNIRAMNRRVKRAQRYLKNDSSLSLQSALSKSVTHDHNVTKAWLAGSAAAMAGTIAWGVIQTRG